MKTTSAVFKKEGHTGPGDELWAADSGRSGGGAGWASGIENGPETIGYPCRVGIFAPLL
jgi:hypothetical protein